MVAWVSPATTVPMMNVDTISTSPFIACCLPRRERRIGPHVTTVTICMGIRQRRKNANPTGERGEAEERQRNPTKSR